MTIVEVGALIVVSMIMFLYGIVIGVYLTGVFYENKSENKVHRWNRKDSK